MLTKRLATAGLAALAALGTMYVLATLVARATDQLARLAGF